MPITAWFAYELALTGLGTFFNEDRGGNPGQSRHVALDVSVLLTNGLMLSFLRTARMSLVQQIRRAARHSSVAPLTPFALTLVCLWVLACGSLTSPDALDGDDAGSPVLPARDNDSANQVDASAVAAQKPPPPCVPTSSGWRHRVDLEHAAPTNGSSGSRVTVFEDTALVGLPSAENGGVAVFFRRTGDGWCPDRVVRGPEAEDDTEFGYAVALGAGTAVIGAPNGRGGNGYVFVLRRLLSGWQEVQRLTAIGLYVRRFGAAVAVSGNRIVVGAPLTNTVEVFELVGESAYNVDSTFPVPVERYSGFGFAVAVSNRTVVVGAPGARNGTGAVFVYEDRDGGLTTEHELVAPDLRTGDHFGAAVAIEGDHVIVGAPGLGVSNSPLVEPAPLEVGTIAGTGNAYAFQRTDDGWGQGAPMLSSSPSNPGYQGSTADDLGATGSSVAIAEGTALIGAPGQDNGLGLVHVYRQLGSEWSPWLLIDAGEREPYGNFGSSVALSRTTAWVGVQESSAAAYTLDLARVPMGESSYPLEPDPL